MSFYSCGSWRDAPFASLPRRTFQILATWLKLSSTGVSRPEMETSTFNFCWSALISLIDAGSEANAPSVTVTESPTSKSRTRTSGLAFFSSASTAGAEPLEHLVERQRRGPVDPVGGADEAGDTRGVADT